MHDTKNMWELTKLLTSSYLTNLLRFFLNNQEISDVLSVANTFNIYFANIGSKLSNLIPNQKNSPLDYLSTNEIENITACLEIGKAVGPFSMPLDILKILKSTVSRAIRIFLKPLL